MADVTPLPHRLVCVQFGDFAGALARQARGEPETYYAQDYSVGYVVDCAQRLESVATVSAGMDQAPQTHDNGILTAGVRLYPPDGRARHKEMLQLIARLRPTHLLLETPVLPLLRWAVSQRIHTLPLFFDSFTSKGLRAKLRHRRLAQVLNDPHVPWVANHGLSACHDLVRIGVAPSKVLPIDWPAMLDPTLMPPWVPNPESGPFQVVYVGSLSEAKGVGDAIRALALLREEARPFTLTVVGSGEVDALRRLATDEGVADRVRFLGRLPHDDVLVQMRLHDAVVVPSRHEYPEGKPMTIYEAFCAKAPLVVSDHPMFRRKVRDQHNALVFPERNAAALADCWRTLAQDAQLGARLSNTAAGDAEAFFLPLKWHQAIEHWLGDEPEDHAALRAFALDRMAPEPVSD